jgi:ribonucleotide reductase beta subunit family protein with ferritin-like domain
MSTLTFEDQTTMLTGTSGRVKATEKRLINNAQVDVNQLMPIKYHWAWEHYNNGCANHWMPTEVPMNQDVEVWRSDRLTDDERLVIKRNLGFFSTAESLVGNNLVLAIFKHVTNAECRQYLLRQAFRRSGSLPHVPVRCGKPWAERRRNLQHVSGNPGHREERRFRDGVDC